MRTLLPAALLTAILGNATARCDNTFLYPTGTYTYRMVTQGGTSTIVSSSRPTATGVTVHSTIDGKPNDVVYKCVGETLQVDMSRSQMGISHLPPASRWKAGYRWTSEMQMTHASGTPGMKSTTTYRIVGMEAVTTPAGRYNAYRVESDTVVALPSKLNLPPGMKLPGLGEPVHATSWYARGVGLVKMTQPANGISFTLLNVKK